MHSREPRAMGLKQLVGYTRAARASMARSQRSVRARVDHQPTVSRRSERSY